MGGGASLFPATKHDGWVQVLFHTAKHDGWGSQDHLREWHTLVFVEMLKCPDNGSTVYQAGLGVLKLVSNLKLRLRLLVGSGEIKFQNQPIK